MWTALCLTFALGVGLVAAAPTLPDQYFARLLFSQASDGLLTAQAGGARLGSLAALEPAGAQSLCDFW